MARKRYKEQATGSFFCENLYERAVPDGYFLRQLEGMVNWEEFPIVPGKRTHSSICATQGGDEAGAFGQNEEIIAEASR